MCALKCTWRLDLHSTSTKKSCPQPQKRAQKAMILHTLGLQDAVVAETYRQKPSRPSDHPCPFRHASREMDSSPRPWIPIRVPSKRTVNGSAYTSSKGLNKANPDSEKHLYLKLHLHLYLFFTSISISESDK